ncbi:MAG: hydrolase [Planctomycetes bacterium]|nr:hydrolase [Planctomycetota bacterium]
MLEPDATALLVIDVQERFRTAMAGFEAMAAGCARLARAFRALGLPVFATEQYPKGLGPTVPEVKDALRGGALDVPIPEKTAFSSCGCEGFLEGLRAARVRCVLVCGIEAHVCVSQTVHDLLAAGYRVHVAADAVESRRERDRELALRRMERAGAVLTTGESAAFELLRDARHPRFKEVQALFK